MVYKMGIINKEMSEFKLSVVIPVYNGEKYLRECVDSILSQTFRNFEIVLVNDGSTDSTASICDEYTTQHDNVVVVHQNNQGINKTRRNGVRNARGEWITFSDADDTMPHNALQKLWDKHVGTDLVIGFPEEPIHKKELTLEECRENAITGRLFPPTMWAKLYRRSLLTDDLFDFPRGIDGEEDMIMNIRIIFGLQRTPHFVFEKVYNYRRNVASISHTKRASLEHEDLFNRVRAQSIPANELSHYMKAILQSRLNGLTGPAFSEPELLCDKQHPYMLRLREDIHRYSYTMTFQEWMLLNIPYAWMYKVFSFLVLVKNFLRYRLGLTN